MIKVLNVTEEGRGGGALGRIRIIAKRLDPSIKTIVVYPRSARAYGKKLKSDGIKGIPVTLHPMTKSGLGAIWYILSFIPELIRLVLVIRRENPDLIHANGSWQIKGIIAGWLTRRKTIWHMNDSYQPLVVRRLFRLLSWMPTGYVYASQRTKIYYHRISQGISPKPSQLISAPVDTDRITNGDSKKRGSPYRFLTVGYINVHKGLEHLLDAAALLQEKEISFDVVGPVIDSQKTYMKELTAHLDTLGVTNVRFLGYKEINNDLLRSYSYYLCSSIREASPMAVWEAMAAGLPIVSTDVGDVSSIIKKYGCGAIAAELDGKSIAQSMVSLIAQDEESYNMMSRSARQTAVECFSTEEVSKKYLRFYTDLISDAAH